MLKLDHITKVYQGKVPYQALTEVSFSVHTGEFVSIMGPSGSGKTTLLNMVANTDSLTSGKLFIKEIEPHLLNKDELADFRRTQLGFVFQQFHLLDTLTIAENMVLP